MNDFDDYCIDVDNYCIDNDIDTYDLYGERMVSDDEENIDDGLLYE